MDKIDAQQASDVTEQASPKLTVRLEATLAARLNLADFQNAVPVLREFAVVNEPADELKQLELTVTSEPAFLRPKTWRIDSVAPGQTFRLSDLDLQLDGTVFGRLTEAEKAVVTFTLRSNRTPERELAFLEVPLELLARNQWGGLAYLPDMVAAFVQPNEMYVEKLLKQAAELLRKGGKNPALNGYNSGVKHAWEIASAIWSAVGAMRLDYCLPPASFEHAGQKVRGPGQIAETGLATCLDLALLFGAALEQAGLNPLLVFTEGHAFAGVWLKKEEFSTTVIDDVTALRKRVKLKELLVFETTLATQQPLPAFSFAVERGNLQIAEDEEQKFELAIDVRRARLQRIKPLASVEVGAIAKGRDEPVVVEEPLVEDAPDLPEEALAVEAEAAERPEDRLTRWQRKLLDLSLRNNLLSFKGTKKALKLDAPDPGRLEDLLAEGHSIKLLSRPDLMEGIDPRNQTIYEGREREDVRREHALDALARKEVFVGLAQDDLDARLVDLFRTARTTLQEGGSNTLYLALGFLSWTRDVTDAKRYRAPLILVPVTLDRRSARSGFSLKVHDDEPRFNPTLIEMLRQDFDLQLGIEDGELAKDDSGLDITGIWKKVSAAIKDIKGWDVVEDVVLSTFSFAKYLMWKDLTERTEQLMLNPVVRHLIETPRDSYSSPIPFPNPRHLDRELPPHETFCPLPADSSQLAAVTAGARGKDFVLIGPPGTGKSQTISNLIAQCLAEGKKVLFVSEKMAALDVVFRRLREVNLGEFCLELHSSKARKTEVLDQLKRSWAATGTFDAAHWKSEAARLGKVRAALNHYVERLHHRHPNGLSAYEAMGRVVSGKHFAELMLSWPSAAGHTRESLDGLREAAELLDVNAQAVGEGNLTASPLAHVAQSDWSPSWQASFIDSARQVLPAAEGILAAARDLASSIGLPAIDLNRRARGALASLARVLPQANGHDWRFVLRPDARVVAEAMQQGLVLVTRHREFRATLPASWSQQTIEAVRTGIQLLRRVTEVQAELLEPWSADLLTEFKAAAEQVAKYVALKGELSLQYTEGIERLDALQLQRDWQAAQQAVWPLGWLKKRAVAKVLVGVATAPGEPDVPGDIQRLVSMKALKTSLAAKGELSKRVGKVWRGLESNVGDMRAAVAFQLGLMRARMNEAWDDVGLDAVSDGRCGPASADCLGKMRELRRLHAELNRLAPLSADTQQVWAGLATNLDDVATATAFQAQLAAAREGQTWLDEGLVAVETGRCGSHAQNSLIAMRELMQLEAAIGDLQDAQAKTNGLWAGLHSELTEVEAAIKFYNSVVAAIASLAHSPDELAAVKAPIERLLGDGNMLLDPAGPIAGAGRAYISAWGAYQGVVEKFSATSGLAPDDKSTLGDMTPTSLADRCSQIIGLTGKVRAWSAWRQARAQAISRGLAPLVAGVEQGGVPLKSVKLAFETGYSRWWLNAIVDSDEVLRTFVSAEHEKRIRDFKELDDRFVELTKQWVRAQLCSDLPSQDSVTRNSEWGVLRYEMQKKRNHLPLRELLNRTPTAITKLAPCLLMSPLSIAQYLSPETASFDVVIFDEASQIPVWDAIGAIARAKQVIMVGDPKQLPPTNFFDRAESDSDDVDVEADLESILDECIGANLPTMNLAWHYRSRHESLIAFSNHRYYGGELVTFPSPVTDDKAVNFQYIREGVYEKGGARTNKIEARALVADLVSRLKSPSFRDSRMTIGVVTFNSEQQRLIEDLLDEERRQDPSIESFFAESLLEPVFVKNLESVQGDERDIMYFSLTYGPTASGAVSMNFGPMNKQGGERRLNVAITRARQELRVFSSLRPEQMDLSRTQAHGVRDLKHFMEFAERGSRALGEATAGSLGDFESPFEEFAARALTDKGWQVHTQVGVSAFRIDLGVVDDEAPGTYLAGVECDGATYHRSATARDRDKLREQVLRGLGWDIVRIWSTDWWVDAAGTAERVDTQLRTLRDQRRSKRAQVRKEYDDAKALAASAIAAAMTQAKDDVPVTQATTIAPKAIVDSSVREPEFEAVYARNDAIDAKAAPGAFEEADLTLAGVSPNADKFFEPSYDATLRVMIAFVINQEGPVRDEVVSRRIARAHGWLRNGARIQEHVTDLALRAHAVTKEDGGVFLWPTKNVPVAVPFRRPVPGYLRPVEEIAIQELSGLAGEFLSNGYDIDAGIGAMARELGLQRLRAASRLRLEEAWINASHSQV